MQNFRVNPGKRLAVAALAASLSAGLAQAAQPVLARYGQYHHHCRLGTGPRFRRPGDDPHLRGR